MCNCAICSEARDLEDKFELTIERVDRIWQASGEDDEKLWEDPDFRQAMSDWLDARRALKQFAMKDHFRTLSEHETRVKYLG